MLGPKDSASNEMADGKSKSGPPDVPFVASGVARQGTGRRKHSPRN